MKALTPFRAIGILAFAVLFWACANDTNLNPGRLKVHSSYGSAISCATATADGSVCAVQDVEAEDDMDVGDDLTVRDDTVLTDDVSVGGELTVTGGFLPGWELFTTDQTATVADCGKIFASLTHLKTVLLPAVATTNAGCCITLINTAADGASFIGFSVNASDAVFGEIGNAGQDSAASGTDDEAFGNTKATAIKGDRATLCSDGVTGWFITEGMGIWASAAQ